MWAGEGGQKWGEENKMRGKKFGRFQKSVIRASSPLDVETGGEWRAKRKLQTLKAISMFLVGNCREEFEKFMNINARHSVFVYSETSPRNAFDSLRVHALKVSSFG